MPELNPPVTIDYSSRDYAALRADLIAAIPEWLPEWTNRSESDFGIVLIEMFAYMGDVLNYYIDRVANEAFLSTAVQRASVLSLAQMLDYRPSGVSAATTTLVFEASASAASMVTVPAGTQVSTRPESPSVDPVVFETDEEIIVPIGDQASVTATQGLSLTEPTDDPVGISNGASDQVFALYRPDIIEDSLTVYVDEDGAGPVAGSLWRFTTHLIDASSEDRVYTTTTDEDGITYLIFGDNVNGKIPTQGAIITASYRVGVGADGNVGAGTLVELVSPIVGIDAVTNPASASGGADAESIESIRRKAPRSLTTLERAVTVPDYGTLAQKVSGVLHAKASASVYTSVTLYIAPTGGGVATTALKNQVLNYLQDKKMIGASITIDDPTYVPIDITIDPLDVLPEYNRQAVATDVSNTITDLLDVDNVHFGYRITISEIYQAMQDVAGVNYGVVTVLSRTGTGLSQEILMDDFEIPSVGVITVTATGGLIGS